MRIDNFNEASFHLLLWKQSSTYLKIEEEKSFRLDEKRNIKQGKIFENVPCVAIVGFTRWENDCFPIDSLFPLFSIPIFPEWQRVKSNGGQRAGWRDTWLMLTLSYSIGEGRYTYCETIPKGLVSFHPASPPAFSSYAIL